jgi:XTP/dITP diphosphohydrolase
MRLLVATTNPGKIREIRTLLADAPVELVTLADLPPIEAPEETGRTFAENARLKARYYAAIAGAGLTVAEDSGLEIDALDGAPGVESARFGGADTTYPEKFALLYHQLERVAGRATSSGTANGEEARLGGARFVCALAVADGDRILFETSGTVEGEIAAEPRGTGGFGYDPIFYYPPFGCTLAEAGDRKAAVSHRGKAFRHLRSWLISQVLRSSPPP